MIKTVDVIHYCNGCSYCYKFNRDGQAHSWCKHPVNRDLTDRTPRNCSDVRYGVYSGSLRCPCYSEGEPEINKAEKLYPNGDI